MENKKAFITADIHPFLQQQLEQKYIVDVDVAVSREKLLSVIEHYEILVITTYLKVDKELIDKALSLKVVARVGSGLENVDVDYAKSKGINVINSPEGNANAVGEHSLGMLLNLMNKINISNLALKQQIWDRESFRGEELDGKTIGIIGYGHTGPAFAKKLAGFEVNILVHDIVSKEQVKQVDIETIQKECDIISLHVPYTSLTHHLINLEFIRKCDKKPIIINTSRGSVVDTPAIIHALKHQNIRGFCVDVFEDEPIGAGKVYPPMLYHQLLNFEHVVATSHVAGWTIESKFKLVEVLWQKMQDFIA
ncbi:MAG TPA: NAD(P)-dependent oxidoreductase [Chitinophagales bacterium]|nr:hydroxyacid dehydrogenase [Chitinophagales bacterium]MCB9075120.1 hydroxyacid dehydrogenase [Chitinophagales bacterium]HMU97935.1 NAD(P)-dependent oxidoreductase [Chitinophagales bacterium]HMV02936.1 NAD(P)-dependent oxidoreductase [Chitinophagales bacterium]HMW93542.1 NAD(P)-dependent oxidoreductase [Chitinophagales bacterium]